jgi:hypothetical protein
MRSTVLIAAIAALSARSATMAMLIASIVWAGSAHASEEEPAEAAEEAEGEEREWLNGFACGAAYSFHILRDRGDAETGEPLKTREHLGGFMISYDRELIPQRLAITISKPFYFNKERLDTPFDVILRGLLRQGPWEGFLGLVVTWNIWVFEGERAAKEGEKNILSFGIGGAYFFNPRLSLDLELGYAYIPTEDIVEQELTAALSGVYHF